MSLQPQSDADLRPIVDGLKALDPLLDLRWDPEAVVVDRGSYSVMGKRIDPTYDGRWQIIRHDSVNTGHGGFHPDRGYTVICHLTEWTRDNGVIRMVALRDGGAYVPVGEWVLEMMHQSDAENVRTMEEIRRRVWAENDRLDRAADRINESAVIDALDHNHFQANFAGGVGNWQGKGADFAAMEARATHRAVKNILSSTITPASR